MGLDAVELIMAVEEAFDFEIPDHEAARLRTAGQLYAYVVGRLSGAPPLRCPSSALFYRTRRALMELSGVPRRGIAPSTPMEAILPPNRRRSEWQRLEAATEGRLPGLELPRGISSPLNRVGTVLLFACLGAYFVCPIALAFRLSLAAALLVWAAGRLVAPFAVQIPARCATVGGTVQTALGSHGYIRADSGRAWDPGEVWRTLRDVIGAQFGVPPESIAPDTDFVYDLGAD
jgi:acyl carrier protein